ncbi:MAG TPA: ABC transporter permease, partial [Rhizobiales bacterium]|nr:ABC transporter permease [Hyphomicrobiales bacterium]
MGNVFTIAKRELAGYFGTPIAYVFLVIFVILSGVVTFNLGNFFARGSADLSSFFNYLPWLLLVFIPAVSMRLWAEERKSGTVELLMTLPVSPWEAVTGKWLASVGFIAVALAATFILWITVNILGDPDNGVILVSYIGALVLAAILLAMGSCVSAFTKNQVVAFVLAVALAFVIVTSGTPIVLDAIRAVAPKPIVEVVAA